MGHFGGNTFTDAVRIVVPKYFHVEKIVVVYAM